MISEPTPETISIIMRLSWSVRSVSPKLYLPAESQVHEVVKCARASGDSPSMITSAATAAPNAIIVERVET